MRTHIRHGTHLFLSLLLLWLAGYAYFCNYVLHEVPQRTEETTDAIIVLTGGNHRVATGLQLFANGRAIHLFISGVNPQVTVNEIKALWKGSTALPPCCITLGQNSNSTIENAAEAREWMMDKHYSSARLVTSGYHMPRALLEFHHALPDVEIIANPVAQKDYTTEDKKFWIITFSEYNKILWRSFVLLFLPRPGPVIELT